eukprot:12899607-Prorocentrum_lima.AAC.1
MGEVSTMIEASRHEVERLVLEEKQTLELLESNNKDANMLHMCSSLSVKYTKVEAGKKPYILA